MVDEGDVDDDVYFLDGEAILRIAMASVQSKLCLLMEQLAGQGRLCACKKCFRSVADANTSSLCKQMEAWGIILVDDSELVDLECARLISNLNPAYIRRPEIYEQKITVIAKARLNGCVLVTDDTGLASSSMINICDKMRFSYETFDDKFGNLP